jgi:hypothetical protein
VDVIKLCSSEKCSVADPGLKMDPDSMWSLDPDSYLQSGLFRIQEGKNDPQKWEKVYKFLISFFEVRDKGLSCSLDVLYGGLGIKVNCNFLQFLVIKTLDPVSHEMLDPDPD